MAIRTGFVYHDRYLDHDTGAGHPERPDRLRSITTHLQQTELWNNLQHLPIVPASEDYVVQVHTPRHFNFVKQACKQSIKILDHGDTHVCEDSYDIALLAAGGVLAAVDAVMSGVLDTVFCAVRPPGHHAESNMPMGFCLFNNVAIAARYAQQKYGAEKVVILDWDVHHGNGTQEIFYDDPSVFFVSLHQYPWYPGTGKRSEQGSGKGKGYTLNIPMPSGSGEKEYLNAFHNEILPLLEQYRPHLIIISAGFDAHRDDPLANINLTEKTFGDMTMMMRELADKHCKGRIISVLEGGYNLQALARSVEAHVKCLSATYT